MYVVTGGAGFIGANIVKGLNERGIDDILVVDNLENASKFRNIVDCEIADYMDKFDFIDMIDAGGFKQGFNAIFHEGACSDTMEHDGHYMMQNNYEYSKILLHYCQKHAVPFLYASSAAIYGGGSVFKESREYEDPLNVYGYSKFLFDQYVRRLLPKSKSQITGFRYFNVYGPREQHKGKMASVAYHFFNQFRESERVRLFEGSGGYDNGEQRRDFIYVGDVVDVNFFFLDNPGKSGIFNVGTGCSQSFNDVAVAAVNTLRENKGDESLTLEQMQKKGILEYIDFPDALKGKYQSFTEADVSNIRNIGYDKPFHTVEQGTRKYVESLLTVGSD